MARFARVVCLLLVALFGLATLLPRAHGQANGTGSNKSLASDNQDMTCESIKSGDTKISIILAGVLSNRLYIVTNDYLVYELPATSLDKEIDKLYINTKPTPMATKFPELWKDSDFQKMRADLFMAWIAMDTNSEYFCFCGNNAYTKDWIFFDIKNRVVNKNLFKLEKEGQQIISATSLLFYTIRHFDKGLNFARYKVSGVNLLQAKWTVEQDYIPLCTDDKDESKIFAVKTFDDLNYPCPRDTTRVRWPILKGFVHQEKVFLFGENYVHMFPEQVIKNAGTKYEYKSVKFKEFFKCQFQGNYAQPAIEGRSYTFVAIFSLILFLILILVLVLVLVFHLNKQANDKQAKQKENAKGKAKKTQHLLKNNLVNSTVSSASPIIPLAEILPSLASGHAAKRGKPTSAVSSASSYGGTSTVVKPSPKKLEKQSFTSSVRTVNSSRF